MSLTLYNIILAQEFYLIKQGGSQGSSGEPHAATEGPTVTEDPAAAKKASSPRASPLSVRTMPPQRVQKLRSTPARVAADHTATESHTTTPP